MSYDKDKFCSQDCQESNSPNGICDFCTHYDFNGDEDGAYTGDGFCNLRNEPSEPHYGCEDFVCSNVVPRNGVLKSK